MRSKTVCFTGHRELPADDLPEVLHVQISERNLQALGGYLGHAD